MALGLENLLDRLPAMVEAAGAVRETLLANLVMVGEIPAPTFREADRIRFLQDRFSELELQNISADEAGNGVGVLPGRTGEHKILVVAHADTIFEQTVDHAMAVQEDRVIGPGVADNALGLAVLATLPTLLARMQVQFDDDIVLLATTRSLGRGDLAGLRFFLDHAAMPFRAGVCVEGVPLGRLSYSSVGMIRGEFTVAVPDEYDWTRFGAAGAIRILNDVINSVNEIAVPRRPRTSILLGSVECGQGYNTLATHGVLRFEIRSESSTVVQHISDMMQDIADEHSAESRAKVTLEILARRDPGGVHFGHPLVRQARTILGALHIEPRIVPSMSELATFIAHKLPAVTLGITHGEFIGKRSETAMIGPMATGLAQVVALLTAIDGGFCDE